MLDVGQGDSLLLRDGDHAVLVDGGGWRRGDFGVRVLLPALLGEGVSRLDVAVLTHPDVDHCGGLLDLASYLPIGELWTAGERRRIRLRRRPPHAPGIHPRPLAAGDACAGGPLALRGPPPARTDRAAPAATTTAPWSSPPQPSAAASSSPATSRPRGPSAPSPAPGLRRAPFDLLKVAHHGSKTSTTPPSWPPSGPGWP